MDVASLQLVQHQHDDNVLKQRPGMHLRGDASALLVIDNLHQVTAGTVHLYYDRNASMYTCLCCYNMRAY